MSRCASECVLVRELKENLCVSVGGGWGWVGVGVLNRGGERGAKLLYREMDRMD